MEQLISDIIEENKELKHNFSDQSILILNALGTIDEVEKYTDQKTGQEMNVKLERDGNIIDLKITPALLEGETRGEMGVGIVNAGIVSYPWYFAVWKGIETTGTLTWRILVAFYDLFKNLGFPLEKN